MQCPVDSEELQKAVYEDKIEVDQCPSCGGMWLDYGELESIQETRENDYSEELRKIPDYFDKSYKLALARTEGTYCCPRCAREMEKRQYGFCSQIMIDVCPSCRGVWLHKDEIKELEIFFEKSRFEARDIRQGLFKSLVSLLK
jgi:Zn-finger nucleic acid-binding protein